MKKTNLNEKLSDALKVNSSEELPEDQLLNLISVADDIEDGQGGTTDLLYEPKDKNMIEFKLSQGGDPMVNFIPLKDFKPDVYGLGDDVFDQVEQFGAEVHTPAKGQDEEDFQDVAQTASNSEDINIDGKVDAEDNLKIEPKEPEEITNPESEIVGLADILGDKEIDVTVGDEINGGSETAKYETKPEDTEEEPYEPEYEEKEGFKKGKKFADMEDEDVTFTEADFKNISDGQLLEFAWKKGLEYSTRKDTIQRLFEHNKITKKDLISFKEDVRKETCNETVNEIASSDIDPGDDPEFDPRDIGEITIISGTSIYGQKLSDMDEDTWQEYQNQLVAAGTTVSYDPTDDNYVFEPSGVGIEEPEGELYEIEEADVKTIENIVKETPFSLKEVKGLPKTTNKPYIMEVLVEKDGKQTTITYNDTRMTKPWSIKTNDFNFLQEAINSIRVPFKELVNDTKEANTRVSKKITLTETLTKKNFNRTDKLPLSEKERREERSKQLMREMFEETEELGDFDMNVIPEELQEFYKDQTGETEDLGNGAYKSVFQLEIPEDIAGVDVNEVDEYLRFAGLTNQIATSSDSMSTKVSIEATLEGDNWVINVTVIKG